MTPEEGQKPEPKPKDGQAPAEGTQSKEGQEPKGTSAAGESSTTITHQPDTFDREYVEGLRAEAARNRKAAQEANDAKAEAQARLDEIEEREKTEAQKNADKAAKAEAKAKEAELQLLRFEVAGDKKVQPEAVEFLQGSTREELEASADKLLKLTRDSAAAAADFDGGVREPPAPALSPDAEHNKGILAVLGLEREQRQPDQ